MSFNHTLIWHRASAILFSLVLLFTACASSSNEAAQMQSSAPPQAAATSTPTSSVLAVGHDSTAPASSGAAMTASPATTGAQGVNWTTPTRWKTNPGSGMRAATYIIPAATGDSEGAECAVFKNIGGGVAANIKRWIDQFEQADGSPSDSKAKQKKETINGLSVSTVDLTGTFKGGGMAMGQPTAKKPGYRLLGAIVETPQGEIFFKLTGPEKTVNAAQPEFQSLIKSIKD